MIRSCIAVTLRWGNSSLSPSSPTNGASEIRPLPEEKGPLIAVMAGLLAQYLPPGGCFEIMSIVDCSVEYGSEYETHR